MSNSNTLVTDVITTSGQFPATFSLTDSRGLTTIHTITITIRSANPPSLTNVFAERCDEDGTLNDEGAYVLARAEYSADTDAGATIASSAIWFGENNPLSPIIMVQDGFVSGQNYIFGGEMLTDSEYVVKFDISDSYGLSASSTKIIPVSFYTIDCLAGGKGIAFGKAATEEGFDVGMNANFENPVDMADTLDVLGDVTGSGNIQCRNIVDAKCFSHISNRELSEGETAYVSMASFRMYDKNKANVAYIEHCYGTSNSSPNGTITGALVVTRVVNGTQYWNQVRCDIKSDGTFDYYIPGPDKFRNAISALTYKYENGYMGVADPSGNNTSGSGAYLRTPQAGLIPYKQDNAAGIGAIGTTTWPFSYMTARTFYRHPASSVNINLGVPTQLWSGSCAKGGSITVSNIHYYRLVGCFLNGLNLMLIGGRNTDTAECHMFASYDDGHTYYMRASFTSVSASNVMYLKAASRHLIQSSSSASSIVAGYVQNVVSIWGIT